MTWFLLLTLSLSPLYLMDGIPGTEKPGSILMMNLLWSSCHELQNDSLYHVELPNTIEIQLLLKLIIAILVSEHPFSYLIQNVMTRKDSNIQPTISFIFQCLSLPLILGQGILGFLKWRTPPTLLGHSHYFSFSVGSLILMYHFTISSVPLLVYIGNSLELLSRDFLFFSLRH